MKFFLLFFYITFAAAVIPAQDGDFPPAPPPRPIASPTPKLSDTLAQNLENKISVSDERREQGYAKLLEGQRYMWNIQNTQRMRNQTGIANSARLAKQAFQKAVELNPNLAEGYTALAELSLIAPPRDADEAIILAGIAVKLNPENFGAQRILARLYTLRSGLDKDELNSGFAEKAIAKWKELTRLDPRFAEAWAFLSAFYEQQGKTDERIDALNRWLGSSSPIDSGFYRNVMGNQETLTPDNASVKLGSALIEAGRSKEAVEILSRAIADDPENVQSIELLRKALESADTNTAAAAVESLRQALFANPENIVLVRLLSDIYRVSGSRQEALQIIRAARVRLSSDYGLLRQEALILTELGKVDEGVKLILPLIGKTSEIPSIMNDDFINYLFISGLYNQAKRGKEAVAAANKAYQTTQDAERKQIARLTLATAQQKSGDFNSAETTLRDILKQSPGNPIALNNLGYFLLERDEKISEAYNLIKQAVKIDPTNPSYLDSLGWAYFKMGNLTEAEKYLKLAAKYDSGSATIQEHLGDVFNKQGKTELARTMWQKALTLSSDTEEINRIKTKLNR